jgi:hypothetical protein
MTTTRNLTCTCCGAHAGRWEQHWNQDTGYGLCARCRDWIWERNHPGTPQTEFERTYGKPGVNYEAWPEPVTGPARPAIEARFTAEGEAAPAGTPNPHPPGSAAATWWQRGNNTITTPSS